MTETSRPADTEGSGAPAQPSTQTVDEGEVATTEIPVEVPNPLWQDAAVDTSGLGGMPDLRSQPVFAQHRADTLQNAINELEGNAPRSGLVIVPEGLTDEQMDAQIADMKVEQARAEAVAHGVPLDEFGNPVEDDGEEAPEEQGEQEGEPAAQTADAPAGRQGDQRSEPAAEEGSNRPV